MKKFFEYTFSVLFFGACAIYFISEYDIGSFEEEKGTTVTDGRGNKYLFKENSVSCRDNTLTLRILDNYSSETLTYCVGSAIKTDIAGQRYVIDFPEALCKSSNPDAIMDWNSENRIRPNALTCVAAKKMGKYDKKFPIISNGDLAPLMDNNGCYSCKHHEG